MDVPHAVGVAARPVAVHPQAGERVPVALQVAVGIVPEPARQADRRLAQHQFPHLAVRHGAALGIDDVDPHAEAGAGEGARLEGVERRAGEDAPTDLGAAADVEDRHPGAADVGEEPLPGVRVPRLAGRDHEAQAREVGRRHRLRAVAHQRAGDGRRHAQVADVVALDQPPETARVGPVGGSLGEHQRAAEQGAHHRLHRPDHPAHVRHPQEAVPGVEVERQAEIGRQLDREPAVRVHGALRAAGCPGGVDEHERRVGRPR